MEKETDKKGSSPIKIKKIKIKKLKLNKLKSDKVFIGLIFILGIILIINVFSITGLSKDLGEKIALAKDAARSAVIQMTTIQDSSCLNCFDISNIINPIKKANVNITEEENLVLNSEKAKELIDKYSIEKIPTVLLFGEIDKVNIAGLEEKGDALVFTQLKPPYTDAKTNQIIGRVSTIILEDSSCDKCTDINIVVNALKQSEVKIVDEKVVERSSKEGQDLINKYALDLLPTLILSKDFGVYDIDMVNSWSQIGTIEDDGSYVTRVLNPPYLDLITNKVMGLVKLTMLTDDSCSECYDVTLHKSVLARMGVVIDEEETIDISETKGQELIEKYDITKVPTILLSEDAGEYSTVEQVWETVGSVEDDGTHVFREMSALRSTYKDLISNKVIKV